MKPLHLTLIATTCALAVTACSTGNKPRSLPEQKKAETAIQADAKKTETTTPNDAKKTETTTPNDAKKTEKAPQEDAAKLVEKEKTPVSQDQSLTEKKKEEQKSPSDTMPSNDSKVPATQPEDTVDKSKLEESRVTSNQNEIKKAAVNSGADEAGISYVSGGTIMINGNQLLSQGVEEKSKNLNKLVIDGKSVTLFDVERIKAYQAEDHQKNEIFDISTEGLTGKTGSLPTRRLGDDFAQMRFGYAKNAEGKTFLFVRGHQTPVDKDLETPFNYYAYASGSDRTDGLRTLPTEGAFDYLGYAFYGTNGEYKQLDTTAVVDLNNKKVKIDLKEADEIKLTLGAKIDGSSFAGNYQGVETKGAFYGTGGRDIGGVFYQTEGSQKDYNGVFGATKQGCGYISCSESKTSLTDFDVK